MPHCVQRTVAPLIDRDHSIEELSAGTSLPQPAHWAYKDNNKCSRVRGACYRTFIEENMSGLEQKVADWLTECVIISEAFQQWCCRVEVLASAVNSILSQVTNERI